jgi:hypothetical protein
MMSVGQVNLIPNPNNTATSDRMHDSVIAVLKERDPPKQGPAYRAQVLLVATMRT